MIFTVVVLLAVGAYGQPALGEVGVCHILTNNQITRSEFAYKETCKTMSQTACTEADEFLAPGENSVEVTFNIQHDLLTQQTCVGKNACTVGNHKGKCMTEAECGQNLYVLPDANIVYDDGYGVFDYCPHDSKDVSCCISGGDVQMKSQSECAKCDGVDLVCNSGFFCAGGLCFQDGFPFPQGSGLRKNLGESCCDDQQCESANCLGGQCSCTTDAECESDEYCGTADCYIDQGTANLCHSKHDKCDCCLDQGWCKDPISGTDDALVCDISAEVCIVPLSVEENGACCSSEECKAPSDFCCSGNCAVRNSKEIEETCDCDEECKSGSCKDGACECTDDYQCPDVNGVDYYCDKGWFFFLGRNSCKPMKKVCDKCERDAECLSGNCKWFKCIDGNENYAMGDKCCRDAQCAGKLSCSSGGQCQCTEDYHCQGGQYCDKGFLGIGQNVCRNQKLECASCGRDGQCAPPAQCSWFKCAITNSAPSIGSSCCRDVQCTFGNCNNNGVCHCTENHHCPAGEYCDEGFLGIGKNECRPLKADCEGCTLDSQCAGECKSFKCATAGVAPSIGSSCCRDHQCAVGSCNSANVCQCTSDSHCPNGRCAVGFLGIGKNKCVPYKAECQSCLFSSQCGPTAACRVGKCATYHSLGKGASCCRDYQCINGNCKWPSRKCN